MQDMTREAPAKMAGPVTDGEAITPSDVTVVSPTPRALYVGAAGNLVVEMVGGHELTFVGVPAGTLLPIRVNRVLSTGTTAASIVALW